MLNNETGEQFLCPTYDHAASLGREMVDAERQERLSSRDKNRQVPYFVSKARSEIFKTKTDKRPLLTVEAYRQAVVDREAANRHWLSRLRSLSEQAITKVFNDVPGACMSESAKTFAILMVMENRRRLLEDEER
jgi:hypothetical protein